MPGQCRTCWRGMEGQANGGGCPKGEPGEGERGRALAPRARRAHSPPPPPPSFFTPPYSPPPSLYRRRPPLPRRRRPLRPPPHALPRRSRRPDHPRGRPRSRRLPGRVGHHGRRARDPPGLPRLWHLARLVGGRRGRPARRHPVPHPGPGVLPGQRAGLPGGPLQHWRVGVGQPRRAQPEAGGQRPFLPRPRRQDLRLGPGRRPGVGPAGRPGPGRPHL